MRETVPQSLRQQELVCLASGHVNCPRYLRGAVAVTALPPPAVRAGRVLTPAMVGALAMLVIAFGLSVGFLMSRGGLELTAALTASPVASPLAVAGASSAPPATALVTPSPVPAPSASDQPTPVPTPPATASPSPTTPSSPAPTLAPSPKSDRYALLSPCPNTPRCWIYVVRRGDNLFSIAHYFGVSLDRVYALNPRVRTTGLRAGLELRLPPPTR